MAKSKLSRRITWRIISIIMIFNVFIIGAVLFFDFKISEAQSEIRSQHLMDRLIGRLNLTTESLEILSRNSVAEIEEHLDSPEAVMEALQHEIRLNHYFGCGIAFEPDYFGSQGRWFEPYAMYVDSTHCDIRQIGSEKHDYFTQDWYQKGLQQERGKGYLTDPYVDHEGAKRTVFTYAKPVFDRQGRKVGVFAMDFHMDWLQKAILEEETLIKKVEQLDRILDPYNPNQKSLVIQILDSDGNKIAGSEQFEGKALQTILKADSIGFEKMKIKDVTYRVSSRRIKGTDWTLIVAQHVYFVFLQGIVIAYVVMFFMMVGGIVIFFFTGRSIHRAMTPLSYLSDSAQEVAQGHFDTTLPTFKHQDEITQLRDSFSTMQQSLKQYVEELRETTAAKASMESELKVAQQIQMSMLPTSFPKREGLDLYAEMTPAKAVGGDLFSYVLQGDQLYICVGDVSGKGVPASLFMSQSTRLFHTLAKEKITPVDIAFRMNNELAEDNDRCVFVTMFIGLIDLTSGSLDFCNCGHCPPVVDGEFLKLTYKNKPLGLMSDLSFQGEHIDNIRGRQMLIYTDGLTEAKNPEGGLFGDERLLQQMATTQRRSVKETIHQLNEAIGQHRNGAEASDDLTMMCLSIT